MAGPSFEPVDLSHSDAVEIKVVNMDEIEKLRAAVRPELADSIIGLAGKLQELINGAIKLGKL